MPDISILEQYLITFTPVVVAVIGMIASIGKVIKGVKEVKSELEGNTDFKEVKEQLNRVISENRDLKRQNKLILSQLTRIKDYDEEVKG